MALMAKYENIFQDQTSRWNVTKI